MNLRHLTDQSLRTDTKSLAEKERELLIVLLYHLKEIDRRRLYSAWGYQSLHQYAEVELKYPGEQAYRRIAAMKLLGELPEIEEKISSGSLSLTHLTDARKLFHKNPCSKDEKLKLFAAISNTSTREAQKVMVKISPETVKPDKMRPLTEDKMEFRFTGSYKLEEKLKEIAGRYAHKHPNMSLGELVEKLADQALESFRAKETPRPNKNSKAEVLRQMNKRDQHKCSKCGSTYAVERDHRIARALGGGESLENLRLLCRSCNQRAAIETFGVGKMERYLKSPRVKYGKFAAPRILSLEDPASAVE